MSTGSNTPAVVTEGLHYRYDLDIAALHGVDLVIASGAFVAIIGQNGSGKTTLAKHLNGLLKPTTGRVCVFGRDTRSATVGEMARTVGYVFQNPDHQIFAASTREEISFGARNLGLHPQEVEERAREALAAFRLETWAEVPPATLGFGLRRLVGVASVLAMRPRLLVLDEPTAGMDRRATRDLMARLQALHRDGHTILLITHDMQLVAEYCPRTIVMHEGRLLADGDTQAVFADGATLSRAGIAPPQVTELGIRLGDVGMPASCLSVDMFCEAFARALEQTS